MALDDAAVIIPGKGFVYFAPAGTAIPADMTAPAAPWESIGHTSTDDGMTITKDGGDVTVLRSWQNASLRSRTDPVVYALTLHLLQVSNEVLSLYFGGGDATGEGMFGVNINPTAQERTLFVRVIDGSVEVPLYVPKVSCAADDDVEADVDNFLAFPIRATVLGVTGSNLMEFYGDGLGAA